MVDKCQVGPFERKDSLYSKKTSSYSRKGNLFSKKASPYDRKDSPYSKQIICPFLLKEDGWPILTEAGEKIRL